MERIFVLLGFLTFWCSWINQAEGHGRMIEPPMRSSAWRYGFTTPKNYNDNELNCGGFPNMMRQGGRCGPCGDPWQGPRDNEPGGKYGVGVITREYAVGQTINVTVQLTSNHKGYFEFRLCPNNDGNFRVVQSCFDQYLLNIDGYGTRYHIDAPDSNVFIELLLSLPPGVSCSNCVLQWKWRAAQNRGPDGMGGECFGCGPQEHFINCADVAINPSKSAPLSLSRGSATGGAVVRFKGLKPSASSSVTYDIQSASKNSAVSTRPSNPVSVQTKPQKNIFTQISRDIFPSNYGMNTGGLQGILGSMFDGDIGYMPMRSIRKQTLPTTPKPKPQPSRHTSSQTSSIQSLLSSTQALTSTIMSYANTVPDGTDNAYYEVCPDGYTKPTCSSLPLWNHMPTMGKWCQSMCPSGLCPAAVCACTCPLNIMQRMNPHYSSLSRCRGIPGWTDATMDNWCATNCNSEFCASEMCICE